MSNADRTRSRLGLTPGRTLTALIELAQELDRKSPRRAFSSVDLYLPWLAERGPTAKRMRVPPLTPTNVIPFARTDERPSTEHYAFVGEANGDVADDRPIARIDKDWPVAEVVAPNLASFLAMVAYAGALGIRRTRTASSWNKTREFYIEEDSESEQPRRRGFENVGAKLCALPGVEPLARPWDVVASTPDGVFALERPLAIEELLTPEKAFERAEELLVASDATNALALATYVRDRGESRLAIWAELRILDARAMLDVSKVQSEGLELAERWLAGSPPFVHPTLWDALLERLAPNDRRSLEQRIRSARDLAERESL